MEILSKKSISQVYGIRFLLHRHVGINLCGVDAGMPQTRRHRGLRETDDPGIRLLCHPQAVRPLFQTHVRRHPLRIPEEKKGISPRPALGPASAANSPCTGICPAAIRLALRSAPAAIRLALGSGTDVKSLATFSSGPDPSARLRRK